MNHPRDHRDETHDHSHDAHGFDAAQDPTEFWETRYADKDRIWSGRPNAALVAVAENLQPGRALDLGSGEGGDVIWLARRGWEVTGVDISGTALARAREEADRLDDVGRRVTLVEADLATWHPSERYDLVSACFLQSPLEFPRADVLRRVADAVAPGGRLLVVAHAAPPPWSDVPAGNEHLFPRPDEELAALGVTAEEWEVEVAEVRERPATGPDGQAGTLEDTVVLIRRR